MDYQLPVEAETSPSVQVEATAAAPLEASANISSSPADSAVVTPAQESNLFANLQTSLSKLSSAIQERADVASTFSEQKVCKPGDFLCLSGISSGSNQMKNEFSKAIVKSFGTMMSEMVNTTISRGLVDFMAKHGSAHGETLGEEHKAMIQMASGALQTVSARVIKSFTFFIQMAISGAMKDLLHNLMDGVTSAYMQHQKSMTELRSAAVLSGPPENIPKPSQPQMEFDPVKTLLQAGALTSLSYPNSGFDLMSSLKSNLFMGDHNSLARKSGTSPVLTPFGVIHKK